MVNVRLVVAGLQPLKGRRSTIDAPLVAAGDLAVVKRMTAAAKQGFRTSVFFTLRLYRIHTVRLCALEVCVWFSLLDCVVFIHLQRMNMPLLFISKD